MFIVLTNKYSVYGNIKAKAELSLPQVAWVFMRARVLTRSCRVHTSTQGNCWELEEIPLRH